MASIMAGIRMQESFTESLYSAAAASEQANQAYLRFAQTVESREISISYQMEAPDQIEEKGNSMIGNLMAGVGEKIKESLSLESLGQVLDLSDSMAQTTAQLSLINDGAQTTQELMDMVYASAQNTHTPFLEAADAVAQMGNSAGNVFDSNAELVAFMEQANKQFAIGGAAAGEQSAAMQQLTQAMAEGVLSGDALNEILSSAPGIASAIEQNMGWAEGSLRSYAEQGAVSAQVVKDSLLAMAGDTDETFNSLPVTFSQVWTDLKNSALEAFAPVLARISEIAGSEEFQLFLAAAAQGLETLANAALEIFDVLGAAGSFIAENWSLIAPLAAGIMAIVAAQSLLNAVMAASPITWIILGIVAIVTGIAALCSWIAEASGMAQTGFGIFCGAVNVAVQFVKNLFLAVVNSALGLGFAIGALAENIQSAFHNAICNVKAAFYGLLSTALTVVEKICEALNLLPFVSFDYSDITGTAEDYAAKRQQALEDKREYQDIGDAFHRGNSAFQVFEDGWVAKAFGEGAGYGDHFSENGFDAFANPMTGVIDGWGAGPIGGQKEAGGKDLAGAYDNLDQITGNTSAISDSLDVSTEDLSYLRDIAEQESINRFTTADIKLEMNNNNQISGENDLDGIIDGLTSRMLEAIEMVREEA